MIAVVYSGSNNAGWRLADKGRTVASFSTNAINPYFNDEKYIVQLFNKNINLIHHAEGIKRIYFFGAGASSDQLKQVVYNAFAAFFKFAKIRLWRKKIAFPPPYKADASPSAFFIDKN